MKNLIVSLAALLATASSPVLAADSHGDPRAERIFAKEFAGAQNVKWNQLADGYQRVTFLLNGVAAETFFDADAELLGTVRNLFYNQLPLAVMQTVNNKFTGGIIIEVKEITNGEGTSYKVILENKAKKYFIRLNSSGDVLEVQKTRLKK